MSEVEESGWYSDPELAELKRHVAGIADVKGDIVEVGVYRGRSAQAIVEADTETTEEGISNLRHDIVLVDDLSMEGADTVYWPSCARHLTAKKAVGVPYGRPIAFLHIDGDHTDKGVAADLQNYAQWVVPGGVIAMHDYNGNTYTGPKEAWQAWDKAGEFESVGGTGSLQVYRRVV